MIKYSTTICLALQVFPQDMGVQMSLILTLFSLEFPYAQVQYINILVSPVRARKLLSLHLSFYIHYSIQTLYQ